LDFCGSAADPGGAVKQSNYQEDALVIRFAEIYWLHLLWLVIPLLWLSWRRAGSLRKLLTRHSNWLTINKMLQNWSAGRLKLKAILQAIGFSLLVLALAAPQVGTKFLEVKRQGVDVVLAVDVSQSMAAQDFAPSRMARARHSIRRLLTELNGDRVALIPFAGNAFLQNPLTTDYNMVGMLVDLLKPGLIPVPGTNLGAPIEEALKLYDEGSEQHQVLIVLSDGEDFEGEWEAVAAQAAEKGVLIFCVGMASPDGAPIPDPKKKGAYKQDANGGIVLSRLNEDVLIQLASIGNGNYYRSSPAGEELVSIRDKIDQMDKKEIGSRVYTGWQERYQWFLLPGLLLLLISYFLPEARRQKLLLLILLLCGSSEMLADPASTVMEGNRSYQAGEFGDAAASYQNALQEDPEEAIALFNLAAARYRAGDIEGAAGTYIELLDAEQSYRDKHPELAAKSWYNLGNSMLASEKPDEALKAYIEALRRNPEMLEAKHNLELALNQQQNQQEQEQDQNQDQENQEEQDQQDQDQQQQDQQNQQNEDQQDQEKQENQQQQDQEGEEEQQQEQQAQEDEENKQDENQPQPAEASEFNPEQIEQLLKSVEEMEQKVMEKQLKAIPGKRRKVEKDW
jgi:Ca-activated chloride channel homolog